MVKSLFSMEMLLKARVNLSKQCFARLTLKNRFPQLGYAPTISNVQNVLEIFRSVCHKLVNGCPKIFVKSLLHQLLVKHDRKMDDEHNIIKLLSLSCYLIVQCPAEYPLIKFV